MTDTERNTIRTNGQRWDEAAEALGFDLSTPSNARLAAHALGVDRPFWPYKHASVHCMSGKRDYCSCDTCF